MLLDNLQPLLAKAFDAITWTFTLHYMDVYLAKILL